MSYKRGSDSSPKPVEMGKEYDVEITELSRMGDGIARVQGKGEWPNTGLAEKGHLPYRRLIMSKVFIRHFFTSSWLHHHWNLT